MAKKTWQGRWWALFNSEGLEAPWAVYLAGKIAPDRTSWRDEILTQSLYDLRITDIWPMQKRGLLLPRTSGVVEGGHIYTGPYQLGDGKPHDWYGCGDHATSCGDSYEANKHEIVEACAYAIERSDVVFAWIEFDVNARDEMYDEEAQFYSGYGTLIELGVASADRYAPPYVVIGTPDKRKLWQDLWFAACAANHVIEAPSAGEAWHILLKEKMPRLAAMPYQEYLQTDHWRTFSAAMKERAGHRCQICNGNGELHTHHRTYERRGEELPEDVVVLCATCHKTFHQNGKLVK